MIVRRCLIGLVAMLGASLAHAEPPATGQLDDEGVLHVKAGTRVRFPYVKPGVDSDGPQTSVVRVLTRSGTPVVPEGKKVLVVLRHSLRWHGALGAMAAASDRAMSWVVGNLVEGGKDVRRDDLPTDILADRGRPSTDTERTINVVVERDLKMERSWTADAIGEYVDQAYYLTPVQIAKLERLAATAQLSPGQVVDALIARALAKTADPRSFRAR